MVLNASEDFGRGRVQLRPWLVRYTAYLVHHIQPTRGIVYSQRHGLESLLDLLYLSNDRQFSTLVGSRRVFFLQSAIIVIGCEEVQYHSMPPTSIPAFF